VGNSCVGVIDNSQQRVEDDGAGTVKCELRWAMALYRNKHNAISSFRVRICHCSSIYTHTCSSCCGSFFNFNLFIFKNNTSIILLADLTLLAAPARVARQDNVAAPHVAARQARHAGTVGLRGLLLLRHMHWRGNVMVSRHVGWCGRRFSNLIYQI
jgi:hypothetical protein